MSSNVIVGNSAGVFSAFLNFFSWMSIAEENDLDISLHVSNKTNDWNNSSTTVENPYIRSSQFDKSKLDSNILLDIFESDVVKKEYPESFIYLEHFPELFTNSLENYPQYLFKYGGKGGMSISYQDSQHLDFIRQKFNEQWNKLSYTKKFQKRINQEEKLIRGKKVIAIMLRNIHHYIDPSTGRVAMEDDVHTFIQNAIKNVRNCMSDYDAVLLTTQNQQYIDVFSKEFGEDCVFTDRPRFEEMRDWNGKYHADIGKVISEMTDEQYRIEVENCLLDVILTSKSDHILGTGSNMFLGALSMNTNNTCELIQKQFWGA